MWELDYKEAWALKNWCFRTGVLEKTLESPLDRKEIKPVNPKGNQPWIFIGRTDAETEAPILWPSNAKSWLTGKDPDAGKEWGQEEKGTTEDDMFACWTRLSDWTELNFPFMPRSVPCKRPKPWMKMAELLPFLGQSIYCGDFTQQLLIYG